MDKKYFVLDFKKIKDAESYKNVVVGHNARLHKRKRLNVDPNKTENNIVLQELKYKSARELIENGNNNLKGKSRKLKKGSAFAFSLVIDCSQMEGWTEQDYIRYLEDAYKFLKEHFKGQEVVHAVVHMDETKPHLHVTFSYFNSELGKWNQRGLMQEKRTDLNRLLNEFEQKVGKRYGLSRGDGKKISQIKRELQKNIKTIKTEERKFLFFKKVKEYKVLSPKSAFNIIRKYNKELLKNIDKRDLQDKLAKEMQQNRKLQKQVEQLEQEKQKFLKVVEQIKQLEQELAEQKQINKQIAEELINTKAKLSKNPQKAREILRTKIKQQYGIDF